MRPGRWPRNKASLQSCHRSAIVESLGSTTRKELYKRRNEVERLFRRLKGFRRVFTRYDKLDEMFTAFILLALIYEALRVFC